MSSVVSSCALSYLSIMSTKAAFILVGFRPHVFQRTRIARVEPVHASFGKMLRVLEFTSDNRVTTTEVMFDTMAACARARQKLAAIAAENAEVV